MNAVQLLRDQLKGANETLEMTMADVSSEIADFNETNKAIPVGAAYAHAVLAEEMIVATMLAPRTPLYNDNSKTGLSEPLPSMENWEQHENWYKTVKIDIPKLKEFAKEVYKSVDDYLASLKEEDLEKEMDLGPHVGKKNIAWVISNYIILHTANLTGEISSVKGLQGLKGYPF